LKVYRPKSDLGFFAGLILLGGFYLLMISALLLSLTLRGVFRPGEMLGFLSSPPIRYALALSLGSSALTAVLSVIFAVPIGYFMSRFHFRGKAVVDAILDVPIVLPPMVVGLGLLLFFMTPMGQVIEQHVQVTNAIPSVVLAQLTVAAAFAVRMMRSVFERVDPRLEQVALTLGCSRGQAFFQVILPEVAPGMLAAWSLSWARAIGEFGPVLLFAGATRFRTEVLPSTIYLELAIGNLNGALAVSLLMVLVSLVVLILIRAGGGMGAAVG